MLIVLPTVVSGSKRPIKSRAFFSFRGIAGHRILGGIGYDFRSWTRVRSSSNHCLRVCSSTFRTRVVAPSVNMVEKCCAEIEIRRRSRCLGAMVRRAMVTHSTAGEPIRKVTSLSFVAFERSTEVVPDWARSRSKLSVRMQILNGRTIEGASDTERLEGVRTLPHKRRH